MTLRFGLLVLLVTAAAVMDVRGRRIPNALTVAGVLAGLMLGAVGGAIQAALAGAGAGLVVGFVLFAAGALGGGDAKLLAAIGALLGPVSLVSVFLYGAVAGGIMTVAGALKRGELFQVLLRARDLLAYWVSFGRRGRRWSLESPGAVAIPFGAALAAGAVVAWFFPLLPGGLS